MRQRGLLRKALGRINNVKLAAAWNTWFRLLLDKWDRERGQGKALRHWANAALSKAREGGQGQQRAVSRGVGGGWGVPGSAGGAGGGGAVEGGCA